MAAEWWQAIGVVVAVVGINKWMLGNAVKSIKEHCADQKENCGKVHAEIWTRVNTHGHKALDTNGSKVTV